MQVMQIVQICVSLLFRRKSRIQNRYCSSNASSITNTSFLNLIIIIIIIIIIISTRFKCELYTFSLSNITEKVSVINEQFAKTGYVTE